MVSFFNKAEELAITNLSLSPIHNLIINQKKYRKEKNAF